MFKIFGGAMRQLDEATARALQGDVEAALQLASFYDAEGREDLARPWWRQAAEAGNAVAQWQYGVILLNDGEAEEGLRLVLAAAEVSPGAMAFAADIMADLGNSARRDEYILRADQLGARADWEADFAAGDELAGLRLIRLAGLTADKVSYLEAAMTLSNAWSQPDDYVLFRTVVALRSCEPSPWEDGERPDEIAALASSVSRELGLAGENLAAFQQCVLESTATAYTRVHAERVAVALASA